MTSIITPIHLFREPFKMLDSSPDKTYFVIVNNHRACIAELCSKRGDALPDKMKFLAKALRLRGIKSESLIFGANRKGKHLSSPDQRAFCDLDFAETMKDKHPEIDTVIIAGMNTGGSVSSAAAGALACGYKVAVVTDHLADSHYEAEKPLEFDQHRALLRETVSTLLAAHWIAQGPQALGEEDHAPFGDHVFGYADVAEKLHDYLVANLQTLDADALLKKSTPTRPTPAGAVVIVRAPRRGSLTQTYRL